ncbi:hypothetical protein HPB47_002547 [Ixodes persulcatus]|uniref:Uncharacterized protein n=1 Tax=Ixodes persulcatus TaxID=34615 RepID=A0AC60PKY8_IXOPE|nr:hypothetical protein HPB47_002547 [Ixodes persulcatus]
MAVAAGDRHVVFARSSHFRVSERPERAERTKPADNAVGNKGERTRFRPLFGDRKARTMRHRQSEPGTPTGRKRTTAMDTNGGGRRWPGRRRVTTARRRGRRKPPELPLRAAVEPDAEWGLPRGVVNPVKPRAESGASDRPVFSHVCVCVGLANTRPAGN